LNSLYYPFDGPSVLFFVMGCHFICRRNWLAYYPTFALAVLNRETSVFLIFVFAVTSYGYVARRPLLWHLIAQVVIWVGLTGLIFAAISGSPALLTKNHLGVNLAVFRDMVAMRGNFLKDWPKLLLACGGTWLVLPWIFRRQPAHLKRALLVIIPFVGVALFKAQIDELRQYGELIPVVFTPLVYSIALELGGARSSESEKQVQVGV
jgi:hypothetical protein